ncbi:nucleotidyltransferase [Heyndrickxia vini]|uniref:tRNA(Met) cytidine acetate ligase n=1 Tax=Heyndrickxia vini TaxID=1476025 RepID=A0ABX7DYK9_9BACI|nr:nucleotidyltransferase [Heyndrickxia vini]QQZ08051.1 nucleotidyltransferase [Heyndrickxia vini]
MKSTGLIVEYNPFHNGHFFHVEEARKRTNADVVIAVMSGNFLQRGEPAIISKWARAKMALLAGVDIVVELPYAFAVQHAEIFAYGSITILHALKCNYFCFGSESGDINEFSSAIDLIENYHMEYETSVKELMKTGVSYPTALSQSFKKIFTDHKNPIDLSKPNNILGFHYMQTNNTFQSPMQAVTIKRKNANYHDEEFASSTIASATSIRKATFESNQSINGIEQYVPKTTSNVLQDYYNGYQTFHNWELYWPFLQYRLLSIEETDLANIYEIEEGIEHRLKRHAKDAVSFHDFMQRVKTKRYTWTRIQRMCVHILTNTKKNEMFRHHKHVEYIRLLGMTENGRKYLNQIKKDIDVPLISKVSSIPNELIELDIRASNVYSQGLQEPFKQKLFKAEYAQPPLYIHNN